MASFRAPYLREYLLLHGVCDVNRESCLRLLRRGKSVFIAVGGATEASRSWCNRLGASCLPGLQGALLGALAPQTSVVAHAD